MFKGLQTMQLYWRYKRLFAYYMEFSKAFGPTPMLNIKKVNHELIIEIPYGCVIITHAKKLRSEHLALLAMDTQRMSKHEKRNRRFPGIASRTTENRP